MFTGIITDMGDVIEASGTEERQFRIACTYEADTIELGASICCSGCCLTVTKVEKIPTGSIFDVAVSSETLAKTTLGTWQTGSKVNLERSLKHGYELGGHMVSGHIDGLAKIISTHIDGNSIKYELEAPRELMKYIAPKGSIALNGTSLTVNHTRDNIFDIMIIPHTLSHTTWGNQDEICEGAEINLEVDMLARYAKNLIQNMNKQG